MTFFLCCVALLTGLLRAVGLKSIAYQAVAHCLVGGLFGVAIAGKAPKRWICLALAVALTVLETICFFYGTL